jgi:Ca-activated chloride channel family protein
MLYNWFQNIEFRNEWVLPLLLALPVIAWFYYRTPAWRKSAFKVTTALAFRIRTAKNVLVHLPFWLRWMAIACCILALARPQIRNVQTKQTGQGIDIVLCMDVSGSMLFNDFTPTRLAVSKEMAMEFVKKRPIDEIGLVIFAGESFTQYPLSGDHAGLLEQIQSLQSGLLMDGTVIGEGLAKAVERLSTSKSKSKVVILLTDGNEQPPETRLIDPLTALEIAKAKGVKVYTIGMGAPGTRTVGERAEGGERSNTFLDENLLKRFASQTGGLYFRATDKESLENIYRQIDRLEKSDIETITRTKFEEQYIYFILAALFFFLMDLVLRYTYLRSFP